MASKADAKKLQAVPAAQRPPRAASAATTARRQALNDRHAQEAVERFRSSVRGFRRVFGHHFPKHVREVETLSYHLAQVEALMPNTVEAIRLARYPGAGNRNPKRMALGLCENLSVLKAHVDRSIEVIEEVTSCEGCCGCPGTRPAARPGARRSAR